MRKYIKLSGHTCPICKDGIRLISGQSGNNGTYDEKFYDLHCNKCDSNFTEIFEYKRTILWGSEATSIEG